MEGRAAARGQGRRLDASSRAAASNMTSAYVCNPNDAVITRNLGFNTRARRIRLGAEGTIPGGLGYKSEMDFANAASASATSS